MIPTGRRLLLACVAGLAFAAADALAQTAAAPPPASGILELRAGDTVVFLGNTLAERMQHMNRFETLLLARFPKLQLRVRNLGWSGDTITLQPRPLNFGDAAKHLQEQKADVILAFFGLNESFDGESGVARFERDLAAYLDGHARAQYNGRVAPRVALISPLAHERLPHLVHVDVDGRNRELARYTEAMRRVAAARATPFVDLFTPSKRIMDEGAAGPLTINGIHLNDRGDQVVAGLLMEGLGFEPQRMKEATGARLKALEGLRAAVHDKNLQFFYRWRPVNAEYVVGRRVEPFGSISFPPEMRQLEEMVSELDQRAWKRAHDAAGVRYALVPAGEGR